MTRQVQGVIHGKTIELDGDLGIADGERVFVQVRLAQRHGLGEKAFCDRRESPRTSPASMRRSTRFSGIVNSPRSGMSMNELLARYEHLLGSHQAARRLVRTDSFNIPGDSGCRRLSSPSFMLARTWSMHRPAFSRALANCERTSGCSISTKTSPKSSAS